MDVLTGQDIYDCAVILPRQWLSKLACGVLAPKKADVLDT
jgi:hypothetical protein